MGQDKALLAIAPDGVTVVESVVRTVGMVADEIVLVGNATADYAFLGLPRIADLVPDAGPLGGIHAALTASRWPHVLVVGCDMPFLSAALLGYMGTLPRDYDVLVPVLDRPQPLHAIYARSCLPIIEQRLQVGRYQVSGWFEHANVRVIDREIVLRYDPALLSCFNMNTPEEYAFARLVLAGVPTAVSGSPPDRGRS